MRGAHGRQRQQGHPDRQSGKDPEIRSLGSSGDKVASLRLATTETWRDKASGERKEKTEWHTVTIFNENIVKVAEQYLKKGASVYVEGQLQTRKWQDKDGQDRYSTEVVIARFGGPADHAGRPRRRWRHERRRPAAATAAAAPLPVAVAVGIAAAAAAAAARVVAATAAAAGAARAAAVRRRASPPTWTTKSPSNQPHEGSP